MFIFSRHFQWLWVLVPFLFLPGCAHHPAIPGELSGPSNLTVLEKLALQILHTHPHFIDVLPDSASLSIVPLKAHEADWFIERAMVDFLHATRPDIQITKPNVAKAIFLEYNVIELSVKYHPLKRYWPGRNARVNRQTTIDFSLNVYNGNETLLISPRFATTQHDTVVSNEIKHLENPAYTFTQATIPDVIGLIQFEPFLIVAVVSSLIYLFYSSRHEN